MEGAAGGYPMDTDGCRRIPDGILKLLVKNLKWNPGAPDGCRCDPKAADGYPMDARWKEMPTDTRWSPGATDGYPIGAWSYGQHLTTSDNYLTTSDNYLTTI